MGRACADGCLFGSECDSETRLRINPLHLAMGFTLDSDDGSLTCQRDANAVPATGPRNSRWRGQQGREAREGYARESSQFEKSYPAVTDTRTPVTHSTPMLIDTVQLGVFGRTAQVQQRSA
ncbi:hypothetical protein DPX16_18538 [Anabarilius grahami]|uniref:Uncharacterized protein n=1 Tax=Anabarilius grahami TaxID=495550 RepID=A0A3N0YYH1_ANAGA|nr:hypothetical protein DPX16_18538 [Anabarilius grahami]